jgi:hypothetical protein
MVVIRSPEQLAMNGELRSLRDEGEQSVQGHDA